MGRKAKAEPDAATLARIAELHFEGDLSFEKIESETGVSRREIRRYIKEARETGIVTISIHRPLLADLEHSLKLSYPHLERVFIVDQLGETEEQYQRLLKIWGEIAAAYFGELVDEFAKRKAELCVGISGGDTLLEFVDALPTRKRPNLNIRTTAIVGRGTTQRMFSHIDPVVNATLLWVKCGRIHLQCAYATASPYDLKSSRGLSDEMKLLAKNDAIKRAVEQMNEIDVAFVGLGIVNPVITNPDREEKFIHRNRITMMHLIPEKFGKELIGAGAVGDIGYCLFDENGEGRPHWELFITAGYYSSMKKNAGVEFYRSMVQARKKVVVIAGAQKEAAVKAGLRGKFFNVWLTNKATADKALEWAKERA